MVHRAQDSRLLVQVLKTDKEYATSLNNLLSSSQSSLAALNAYASSCPPTHARAMLAVVNALSGAEEALRTYSTALDAWRAELKRVKRAEDVVSNVLRDREILIGRLIKVTNKRSSTRDSVGLANQFLADPTLGLQQPGAESTATLLTSAGSSKLSHAQAELQACEAHLATKEKELDDIRQDAIRTGLERRCKALVSCGWTWSERGKQALHALESMGNEHSNGALVTSDDSPAKSAGSKTRGRAGSPSHGRSATLPEISMGPAFKLDIGPAHSIDDHDNIHDAIPSSKPVPPRRDGDSSDEEVQPRPLEVHENHPFGKKTTPPVPKPTTGSIRASRDSAPRTLRRPPPSDKVQNSPRIGFPRTGSFTGHKAKHSSDLGPRTYVPSPQKPSDEGSYDSQRVSRKRSTSISLLNGITGMFKGKKRSASAERDYPVPMSTGGWHTRTDKNLSRSRGVGGGRGNSSSEEDLPSTMIRRAKMANNGSDNESETKKLSKKHLPSLSRSSKKTRDSQDGTKYTIVERQARTPLTRTDSQSSRKSEKTSTETSRENARETAANTAMNAGTMSSQRSSIQPDKPKWDATPEGMTIMNRLQQDRGTSDLTLSPRSSELAQLTEQLQRLEEMDRSLRSQSTSGSTFSALPPPKLEVVRAPPSVTEVPMLVHSNPTTAAKESTLSPRNSLSRSSPGPDSEGFVRGHRRQGSISSPSPLVYPSGGANLKARSSISSRDTSTPPLKPALKSPNRASAPLPALPSILAKASRISPEDGSQDRNSDVPTPLGAKDGLKPNGDTMFVHYDPRMDARSPPTTPSILVPTPRRLSEIPASVRSSVAGTDDGEESAYETPDEQMSGEEEEKSTEGAPTPMKPSPKKDQDNLPDYPIIPDAPVTPPRRSISLHESSRATESANVDTSATSTASNNSTQAKRKSVRMIIYPTASVSPPERYDDELPTPRAEDPSPPVSPPASGRTGGGPSAWETRINTSRNAWEDSSEEDEDYRAARRALARASEPFSSSRQRRG